MPKLFVLFTLLVSLTLLACGRDVAPTPAVTPPIADTHTPTPAPTDTAELAEPTATLAPPTVAEVEEPTAVPTDEPAPTPIPTETPRAVTAVTTIQIEQIASGYTRPTFITHAFDDRLFVVEERGLVTIIQDGERVPTPFLDIQDRVNNQANEQGLFSILFHPDYPETNYFFVNYTRADGSSVISRMSVSDDPNRGDPASELVMLVIGQPYNNHNGGQMHFGPDGYLYIGMGDGGSGGDPLNHGQDATTLLGSMLRIDVNSNSERGYAIPPDNPYLDNDERPNEIWGIGLRNPWRFSFDRLTGDLYVADVGQSAWEEIHLIPAGTPGGINFGWNIMEGRQCFRGSDCDQTGLDIPIWDYDHSNGCSITGGYVYRGEAYPELWGNYFFSDYCSGNIWALVAQDEGEPIVNLVLQSGLGPASFGQDANGEVYISDHRGGGIYRLTP